MNITSGKIKSAQKVVIYGAEGIGKSTFASHFPDPIFIDTEGSTKKLDIKRFDKPTSWEMLKKEIQYAINNPSVCKTLVIDTIDWAEQLCISAVCAKHDKKGIEEFGYGNGYVYEKEEFGRFLMLLDEVIAKGINVVLTAHAQLRKFEQPDERGAYDRWELKLGKKTASQISPLVKEWADMVLFANYKTLVSATDKDGKKFKAQGGRRVMYTSHHPCWDAKNRDGLPEELDFDYSAIAKVIEGNQPATPKPKPEPPTETPKTEATQVNLKDFEILDDDDDLPKVEPKKTEAATVETDGIPKELADLMKMSKVTEAEIRQTCYDRGHYPVDTPIKNYDPNFIDGWIIAHWATVVSYIKNNLR